MNKHKECMSTRGYTSEEGLGWIRAAVELLIPPGTKFVPGSVLPTYSASYETSRKDGGNHGSLTDNSERPVGLPPITSMWEDEVTFSYKRPREISEEFLERSELIENDVRYQALPEPGKFRIITAGRECLYTGLQSIQKFLLAQWKKLPFGTMVDDVESLIADRMSGHSQDYIEDGEFHVAGDYSSATDLMHLDATLAAVDRIIENLDLEDTLLGKEFRRSFEGAIVHYPDGTSLRQVRGQLMGHPCSFPILCVINLSTYMRITERYSLDSLKRSRLLINGDDILFKAGKREAQLWREYAGDVGLTVNEEKTYIHRHWYLINSILGGEGLGTIPYYAKALAMGHRIKSEPVLMLKNLPALESFVNRYPIERGRKRLWRLLMSSIGERITGSRFRIKFNKDGKVKRSNLFTRNYFLPKVLGGLGLKNRTGKPFHITCAQRKLATYVLRDDPGFLFYKEKIMESPTACEEAVRKFHRMKPATELLIDAEGRHIQGPLNYWNDPNVVSDLYLRRCLQSTAWLRNENSNEAEYRMKVFTVPEPKEKNLISKRKLLNFSEARLKVVTPEFE